MKKETTLIEVFIEDKKKLEELKKTTDYSSMKVIIKKLLEKCNDKIK